MFLVVCIRTRCPAGTRWTCGILLIITTTLTAALPQCTMRWWLVPLKYDEGTKNSLHMCILFFCPLSLQPWRLPLQRLNHKVCGLKGVNSMCHGREQTVALLRSLSLLLHYLAPCSCPFRLSRSRSLSMCVRLYWIRSTHTHTHTHLHLL
jgi:hypothetical protein